MQQMSALNRYASVEWWHIKTCAIILLSTGIIKLYSAAHPSLGMSHVDPVFGIKYNILMTGIGVLELLFALVLLCNQGGRKSLDCIFALGLIFLIYHMVWWITGVPGLCPCLGNIFRMSKWMQDHQNVLVWAMIYYFIFGSLSIRLKLGKPMPQGFESAQT